MAWHEASEYDFVVSWAIGSERHFCPVQLKELVPADLNPGATVDAIVGELQRYAPSQRTALAIRINRRGRFALGPVDRSKVPFRELWFFGSADPNASRWSLFGDALTRPHYYEFTYPD